MLRIQGFIRFLFLRSSLHLRLGLQYQVEEMQIRSESPPVERLSSVKSILVVLIRNCLGTSAYVRFSVLCSKVILCLSSHLSFSCHSFPKDECGVEIDYQLFGSEEMSHGFFFFLALKGLTTNASHFIDIQCICCHWALMVNGSDVGNLERKLIIK